MQLMGDCCIGVAGAGQPRSAARAAHRARSARSRTTSTTAGQLTTGRANCCFNLRRTACLCAASPGFAGDLGNVIDDCVFSRAMVNATLIAGPNPAERNKMERYRSCRSAAVGPGGDTAMTCRRSPCKRPDALATPRRIHRRPLITAASAAQTTSAAAQPLVGASKEVQDNAPACHVVNPIAELIPRLYRTYGHQFTKSYRQPAAPLPPPTVRGEASDDDAVSSPGLRRTSMAPGSRRGDRVSSARSFKNITASLKGVASLKRVATPSPTSSQASAPTVAMPQLQVSAE